MQTFDPSLIPFPDTHRLLLGGVAPRPIAFVASLDKEGRPNLAPFSFFNAFGANPPVICFSPAFSGRTGAPKDTLLNVLETGECTVSIVSYAMMHQMSLASAPFERGVDEFVKAGFTKRDSTKVKAPGVAESPFIMEAKLLKHVDFGSKPAGANMLICEILLFHVREDVMNEKGGIDPKKMDQVARMGGSWYTRAAAGLFEYPQPGGVLPGIDALPEALRSSKILTGSDLAKLASISTLPVKAHLASTSAEVHRNVSRLLEANLVDQAWDLLTQD